MDNVLLGKVMKAMYKLGGKTLTQLSDETGLTVDTINNLFYARVQKPGFIGVSSLVKATGHTTAELDGFLELAESLPADTDITEAFTEYLISVRTAKPVVPAADTTVHSAAGDTKAELREEIHTLNEAYEKEFERLKDVSRTYSERMASQYRDEITRLEAMAERLKGSYDRSVEDLETAHEQELERREKEVNLLKKVNLVLLGINALITVGIVVILIVKKG